MKHIEVHAHRGDRGSYPENSIPAFLSAVEKEADALEMDVVISKEGKVVVSHEPYMSSRNISTPNGRPVQKEEEKRYRLFKMKYEEIKKFDGGSRGESAFPRQRKMKTYKPLLEEVIELVEEKIAKEERQPVLYNIEIKSNPSEYGQTQPFPEDFVDLVMDVVLERKIAEKVQVQSFDPEILNILKQRYPDIPVAFLVQKGTVEENLARLNFKPEIYSPSAKLLKEKNVVDQVQSKGIKIIPWTVNRKRDILKMLSLEVDGIITDYPEKVQLLL